MWWIILCMFPRGYKTVIVYILGGHLHAQKTVWPRPMSCGISISGCHVVHERALFVCLVMLLSWQKSVVCANWLADGVWWGASQFSPILGWLLIKVTDDTDDFSHLLPRLEKHWIHGFIDSRRREAGLWLHRTSGSYAARVPTEWMSWRDRPGRSRQCWWDLNSPLCVTKACHPPSHHQSSNDFVSSVPVHSESVAETSFHFKTFHKLLVLFDRNFGNSFHRQALSNQTIATQLFISPFWQHTPNSVQHHVISS